MVKPIPDRWLQYTPIGKPIKGTRFIAFKVPLRSHINENVPDEDCRLDPALLLERIPNLGLIIDLTNTYRYYDPFYFKENGVYHLKFMMEGRGALPAEKDISVFNDCVQDFLDDGDNDGKLIGVHCTHGVNRTGYVICQYMVKVMNILPLEAIKLFEEARGHPIERHQYLDSIKAELSCKPHKTTDQYRKRRHSNSDHPDNWKRESKKHSEPINNVFDGPRRSHTAVHQPYIDNVKEQHYQSYGKPDRYRSSHRNSHHPYHSAHDNSTRNRDERPSETLTNWRTQRPTEPVTNQWRSFHNDGPRQRYQKPAETYTNRTWRRTK